MSCPTLRVGNVHCMGRLATHSQVLQTICFWGFRVPKEVRSGNLTKGDASTAQQKGFESRERGGAGVARVAELS